MALQAFPPVSAILRGLELESLTQNMAPGEELTLGTCSLCERRCASLLVPLKQARCKPAAEI